MADFELIQDLVCPVCKNKKVVAAIWIKDGLINYRFNCCGLEEKLLKFQELDKVTKEFVQKQLDSLI